MRPEYFGIIIFIVVAILAAFACQGRKSPYDTDVESVMESLQSDSPPALIDVREPEEFTGELGHIPGSRLIPLGVLEDSIEVIREYEGREIIMVCRSGNRSGRAVKTLLENGISNVFNLAGGMKRWNKLGGEIAK